MSAESKRKTKFFIFVMPSAVVTYPKLQQMSAESKEAAVNLHYDTAPIGFSLGVQEKISHFWRDFLLCVIEVGLFGGGEEDFERF